MKETNLLVILYDAIVNYPKTILVIAYSYKRMFAYTLVLVVLASIPNFLDTLKVFELMATNGQSIANQIPAYEVTDGKMTASGTDGFIYKTDLMTYAYDPDNSITTDEVTTGNGTLITLENNTDNVTLTIMGQAMVFTYDQLASSGTSEGLKTVVTAMSTLNLAYYPLVFIMVAIGNLFNILLAAVMIALVIGLLPDAIRLRLKFKMRLHLAIVSITMPLLVITICNLFGLYAIYQLELMYLFALVRIWLLLKKVTVIKIPK